MNAPTPSDRDVAFAHPGVPTRPAEPAGDVDAAARALDGVLAAQGVAALREQLAPAPECTDEVCVTCSDEGRVAEVVDAGLAGTATVRTAAGEETVMTLLVDPVAPGDLLLVHAGTAIARLEDS